MESASLARQSDNAAHYVEIYGHGRTVGVNSLIYVDTWTNSQCGSLLEACEWSGAEFRLPSTRYIDVAYPVNIKVTGRTYQRKHGCLCVKVAITFVHENEDEENSTTTGWWCIST